MIEQAMIEQAWRTGGSGVWHTKQLGKVRRLKSVVAESQKLLMEFEDESQFQFDFADSTYMDFAADDSAGGGFAGKIFAMPVAIATFSGPFPSLVAKLDYSSERVILTFEDHAALAFTYARASSIHITTTGVDYGELA